MYDILCEFNIYAAWPALKVTDRMFVQSPSFFLKVPPLFKKFSIGSFPGVGGKNPIDFANSLSVYVIINRYIL